MNLKERPQFTQFKVFQILGFLIGGVVPILLFLLLETMNVHQSIMPNAYVNHFLAFTIIGLFIGLYALIIEHHFPETSWQFGLFFLGQALYSFFIIHLLVLYTGGPKSSVFALSYLYLPTIVGYTYGPGQKLYGAATALTISYVLNLFCSAPQKTFFNHIVVSANNPIITVENNCSNDNDNWIYLVMFLIQILITTKVAARGSFHNKEILSENITPSN